MDRLVRTALLVLAAFPSLGLTTELDVPRGYASAATGRLWLLGPRGTVDRGSCVRMELGLQTRPGLSIGMLAQASNHDALYFEFQQDAGELLVPGDLQLGLLGAVATWHPRQGALQPALSADLGAAGWSSPVQPEAWWGYTDAILVPTRGLGAFTSMGADLGVEVADNGPVISLGLDLGWLLAGPLSGPTIGGRVAFDAAL
jgi:hypothetical protein